MLSVSMIGGGPSCDEQDCDYEKKHIPFYVIFLINFTNGKAYMPVYTLQFKTSLIPSQDV